MNKTHEIRLTELDVVRLESALMEILRISPAEPQGAAELEVLLDSAAIVPAYGERQFVVAALTFQPEAAGRFDL
jgi:hypothetical protein